MQPNFNLHPLGSPEADADLGDYVEAFDRSQSLVRGRVVSVASSGNAEVEEFVTGRKIYLPLARLRVISDPKSKVDAFYSNGRR